MRTSEREQYRNMQTIWKLNLDKRTDIIMLNDELASKQVMNVERNIQNHVENHTCDSIWHVTETENTMH